MKKALHKFLPAPDRCGAVAVISNDLCWQPFAHYFLRQLCFLLRFKGFFVIRRLIRSGLQRNKNHFWKEVHREKSDWQTLEKRSKTSQFSKRISYG
jgi:hypothetical protein